MTDIAGHMEEKKKSSAAGGIGAGREKYGNEAPLRSKAAVMSGLVGMVRPLLPFMFLAVLMGSIGNLMASFLTILGGYGLLFVAGIYENMGLGLIFGLMLVFAVLRGILRYAEQASNHFIAFKLLAEIRHKVFAALRRLAPAKLDGSEKGNLISIITSDIELLEVFYAHTISPIAIAVITSLFMVFFLGRMSPLLGAAAAVFYVIVGCVIPVLNGRAGKDGGLKYRKSFGKLNTIVLDNLYGMEEILQYQQEQERLCYMQKETKHLEEINEKLKKGENIQKVITDGMILFAGTVMAVLAGILAGKDILEPYECVIAVIAMMSSFGPTAALSALSNNLHHTLASGSRVLDILEEQPLTADVKKGAECPKGDIECRKVSFSYENVSVTQEEETILNDFTAVFNKNKIHGIFGKSGCGKSTLLKLLMRFYETQEGCISYGGENVNGIKTSALRRNISYVTQETFLFHDTMEANIKVANPSASHEEVVEAAKKASIHEFILSLPEGYETKVSELGDSVSGGEKQRIGLARAFLHDADYIFLDEPTSNIDSLNEGIILKSLTKAKRDKTILLVSHRKSTMGITDHMTAVSDQSF